MSWNKTPRPEKRNDDNTLIGFDEVPLFMKTLPSDKTENVALSALQDLAYEGTPDGGSIFNHGSLLIGSRNCAQF